MPEDEAALNIGVAGLGLAGMGVIPSLLGMPGVSLGAVADTNQRALLSFRERFGEARTYNSFEELCADPEVDAVWIATPNLYHCKHTVLAANHGKHVIVEKPMAISLPEAQQMIEAAERNGVQLICGGSRSSSAVVRKMREIVRSGELGALRALTTWASTDWMLRPRRPDEYDVTQGGRVAFRQAPHQVDSIRLLSGGIVHSVRGMTGQWMPPRDKAPGFLSALLELQDGAFATLIYGAYGYFMASEFFEPGAGGPDAPGLAGRIETRRQIVTGSRDEVVAKAQRTQGSSSNAGAAGSGFADGSRYLSDLGLLLVSCEHGEMRQSPRGIYVYGDEGTREVELGETRGAGSPEVEELRGALYHGTPALHDGRWGQATLEVCLAIMQSAREHKDVGLSHQVPVRSGA